MPSMKFKGLDKYSKQITALYNHSEEHIKKAAFQGAKEVADTVRAELAAVPYISDAAAIEAARKKEPSGISYTQKQGLLDSLGLAKMENLGGNINTKIGFEGYNDVKTKKFPNGQPNAMIARSLDSGSTATLRNAFMRRATSKSRKKAEKAMEKTLDEEIAKAIR